MPAAPTALPDLDGRKARSNRTQHAVARGMLDCLEAGIVQPTAKQVAEQAAVSVRAVFRHFDDLESLFASVSELQYERVIESLHPVPTDGPLPKRVTAFVREHTRLNERIAPVRRAAAFYERSSPAIAACRVALAASVRIDIRRTFAHELDALVGADAEDVLDALAAVVSWSQWEEVRTHAGLSRVRARRVIERQVRALLGCPAPESALEIP